MQVIVLIVGIVLGVYGHSWMQEKFPNTRPDFCSTTVSSELSKDSKDSIGTKRNE